ncbi:MAG: carcinine hydrolase/isopenicillin-N N-acyltransferase family protein [Candidatus Micrarchaeia archaeon]
MCTLGAKRIDCRFFIFKNRDRENREERANKTRIALEKGGGKAEKLLVIDRKGHCEGLNEFGIGFVEATLQPYPRARIRTISHFARNILDQPTLEKAISAIKRRKTSCNVIISDGKNAFAVEKTPYSFAATRIAQKGVLTNLSVKLNPKNGSKLESVREWARARYERGNEIIGNVKGLKGIIRFLSDRKGWPDRSICSGGNWWIRTRCSYIYDLEKRTIYFCGTRPDKGGFKKYSLPARDKA